MLPARVCCPSHEIATGAPIEATPTSILEFAWAAKTLTFGRSEDDIVVPPVGSERDFPPPTR
jgi:hypothetical protein